MNIVAKTLAELTLGPARTFAGLSVFPLIGPAADRPAYRTLDEALAQGSARVTEVSSAGAVPELCFVNDGDRPVLLVDGEELVGAKQNRILNLTILAPAGKTLIVPVSCVEAGRWHPTSVGFRVAPHMMYSEGRRDKFMQVSSSLEAIGRARSNQGAVWDGIARLSKFHGVHDQSQRMGAVFESRRESIDDYVRAFEAVDGQVGAIFALSGRLDGVECFDQPATLRRLLPKLIRSWALDALAVAERAHEVPAAKSAQAFLDRVAQASMRSHDAVGLGEDVRLGADGLTGGALVHDGRVVHLCAFRVEREAGSGERSAGEARMSRASARARGKQ